MPYFHVSNRFLQDRLKTLFRIPEQALPEVLKEALPVIQLNDNKDLQVLSITSEASGTGSSTMLTSASGDADTYITGITMNFVEVPPAVTGAASSLKITAVVNGVTRTLAILNTPDLTALAATKAVFPQTLSISYDYPIKIDSASNVVLVATFANGTASGAATIHVITERIK